MIPYSIILEYGIPLPALEGQFYNCFFDEKAGKYDLNKPHKHKVIEAWLINRPDYICYGICYKQNHIDGNYISGCNRKNFSEK